MDLLTFQPQLTKQLKQQPTIVTRKLFNIDIITLTINYSKYYIPFVFLIYLLLQDCYNF